MSQEIIIGIVVIALITIYVLVREHINKNKGFNSEEKQELKSLVNKLIPEGEQYEVVYASHIEKETRRGAKTKSVTTRAWYYAVAFQTNATLWVIPLRYDGGNMTHQEPIPLSKETLRRVKAMDGSAKFYNLEDHCILEFDVHYSNTKDGIACPVNIQQEKEQEAYITFLKAFAKEVNDEHDIPNHERTYR